MKHPKRYCVSCDSKEHIVIKENTSYSMFHCQRCGEEICRVGDGIPNKNVK